MQNNAIIFRRATLRDLPLVQQIGRDTYTPYYAHVWKNTAGMEWYLEHCFGQETLERDLQNPAVEYYLPADESGRIMGLLKLVTHQPVPNGSAEKALFLEKIYLLPDFYGKGRGQQLISMVCSRARALGCEAVWLKAMCHAGPVEVYERAGFRKEGLVHFDFEPLREDQREGWLMVKHLPQIEDYSPAYAADFKRLNLAWISRYFSVEPHDLEQLEHPDQYILQDGGHVLLARLQDQIEGTAALVYVEPGVYELAKMSVDDAFQGQRIGLLLGEAAIARARALGAHEVWLESNRRLEPALQLYRKMGFVETPMQPTPYARADIRMTLSLTPGIRCRQANEKDLPALVDLARNTFKEAFAHLNPPEDFDPYVVKAFTIEQFSKELNTTGTAFYLFENEGLAVGYFKLNHGRSPLDTDDPVLDFDFSQYADTPITELERIYLSACLHGSGLAQQMIADAEQLAQMQGSRYLWLGVWDANYKSRRFYEKCGFERIGDHRFLLGDDEQRDILLWKELGLKA